MALGAERAGRRPAAVVTARDAMTDGAKEMQPHGEPLRRALRWLDDAVQDEPGRDRVKLVSDASVRFDLTPMEEEFLLRTWVRRD